MGVGEGPPRIALVIIEAPKRRTRLLELRLQALSLETCSQNARLRVLGLGPRGLGYPKPQNPTHLSSTPEERAEGGGLKAFELRFAGGMRDCRKP